jgi:hypothetical protein
MSDANFYTWMQNSEGTGDAGTSLTFNSFVFFYLIIKAH